MFCDLKTRIFAVPTFRVRTADVGKAALYGLRNFHSAEIGGYNVGDMSVQLQAIPV